MILTVLKSTSQMKTVTMAARYSVFLVLLHFCQCIAVRHVDVSGDTMAHVSSDSITLVPTNSYASMEDQIAAVFNKVAYDSPGPGPSPGLGPSTPTPASPLLSTTQKVFVNSPKIITGYSPSPRAPLDWHKSLPTMTAFPPIEWFTKENFPLVRLNITSPPSFPSEDANISEVVPDTTTPSDPPPKVDLEDISHPIVPTRSPFSLLDDNVEEEPLAESDVTLLKPLLLPTVEVFWPKTTPISIIGDKSDSYRENHSYPNDDPFINPHNPTKELKEQKDFLDSSTDLKTGLEEWGVAWELHVYVVGSLFLLIGLYSIVSLFCLKSSTRVVPNEYFVLINSLLFVLSTSKAIKFFFDPYNMKQTYSPPISNIMEDIIYPCLTSSLFILLVCLLRVTKVQICANPTANALGLFLYILFTFALCLTCDILYGILPTFPSSHLVNRVNTILNLIIFSSITLSYYKKMLKEGFKLKTSMMIERYSKLHIRGSALPKKLPCLGLVLAVKVSLSIALFSCLLAALLAYGSFAQFQVFGNMALSPWQWWIYQFSMRILEIILACLLAFVSSLRLGDIHGDVSSEACVPSRIFSIMRCNQATCGDNLSDVETGVRPQTERPGHVLPVYDSHSNGSMRAQQKKKKLPRKSDSPCGNAPFYHYNGQPPTNVINTSRGVIPRDVVEQCMNFIPPHVYEELYYHVSHKAGTEGHEYASLDYDTTVKSAMEAPGTFSVGKSSKYNPLRHPILSADWLSGKNELFDKSLADECFSYPPSRDNTSTFDVCSLSKMGSTCSSQSAAHSFDVQLFLSPHHIHSEKSTPGRFRAANHHEGITSFINSSNGSSSDRMGDHISSPFKRPLPPVPPHTNYRLNSTTVSPGTLSCGSGRDRRVEWVLGEAGFLDRLGQVRSLYDGSDSDVFSSVGLTSSGEASHEEGLTKTPTSHLKCRYPGLELNLKQHSDLFLYSRTRDAKAKDITPDSAVVADIKDSPFHQGYPVCLSPRAVTSSPCSDNTKERFKKSSLSRVTRQKSFKSSDLTLAKRASKNLLHKIKGSNFSLNSSYHGYSPLNSEELHPDANMKRCQSEYEVELNSSDLKVTISSGLSRSRTPRDPTQLTARSEAEIPSAYHIELSCKHPHGEGPPVGSARQQ